MKEKYQFDFNSAVGVSTCIITDENNNQFIGKAYCLSEDMEFLSEITGCYIAEQRAKIKQYKFIKQKLIAQKELLADIQKNQSISKSTKREIAKHYQEINNNDIQIIRNQIRLLEIDLKNYIDEKETFYLRLGKGKRD